jgi:hypothetical protein
VDNEATDEACETGMALSGLVAEACFVGEESHARTGFGLAAAGDLDGDGTADLVITAPQAQTAELAYLAPIWTMGASGLGETAVRIAAPDDPAPGDLGYSVADVGDFDGDGMWDLVLGAPGGLEAEEGYAGLILGPIEYRGRTSAVHTRLIGITPFARTGHAVVGLGDTDGDGLAELAVSAPLEGEERGVIYLVHGPLDGGEVPIWSVSDRVYGTQATHQAGTALSAGDLDGDGLADLVIGAPGARSGDGQAYVVLGPVSNGLVLTDADYKVGETGRSGASLDASGDIDGDGLDDLVVGAPAYSGTSDLAGAVAIYLSPPGETPDAFLVGVSAGDGAGTTLTSGLDLDGDGRDEVVVGAPLAPLAADGTAGPGTVWVAWGPLGGTVSLADLDSLTGSMDGDALGQAMTGVPGGSWEGNDALAISAWAAPSDGSAAGTVWIFR